MMGIDVGGAPWDIHDGGYIQENDDCMIFLDFFLRIYWCRNFCDMAEISDEVPKIVLKWSTYRMYPDFFALFESGVWFPTIWDFAKFIDIEEISAISQKFLHRYIRKKILNILSNHHFPVYSLHHGYLMGAPPPDIDPHHCPPFVLTSYIYPAG